MTNKSLTFIEISVPVCTRTYGVAPCIASIPATGAIKCFNCRATCQDRPHLNEADVTLRFAKPTEYRPDDIDIVSASISEVSFTPSTISLGENLGTRATLQVTFLDHPHSDAGEGFDKYLADRDYDPYRQGTFWGKFRARFPYLRGRSITWYTGLLGQSLDQMEARRFVIDSFDGPTPDGKFSLIAKDILKLAAGDRSQAPVMNSGFLVGDVTNVATSLSLSPSGIGNEEYPASGYATIGGKEVVSFTRVNDVVTITRAQYNTLAVAHKAQDRFQVALRYDAEDPADIVADLITEYTDIDAGYIPLAEWQAETEAYNGRVYTALICEPTSVETLLSELVQQACLCLWWDDRALKIKLQVLRSVLTDVARFTSDNTLENTLKIKEQPEKRLSQVWVYFGQVNPLKNLTETENYRSTAIVIDQAAEDDYGAPVIKKIFSRWIPQFGRTVADRLSSIQLGRYRDAPRRSNFDLMRYAGTDVQQGGGYRVAAHSLQDATGAAVDIPVQVTRVEPAPDRFKVEAEEALFNVPEEDLDNRLVLIDADNLNVNMRAAHDSIYPAPESGNVITLRINEGVVLGSAGPAMYALVIGSWPVGVTLNVVIAGRVSGAGGVGGKGGIMTA
ncbi:hypothetical protein RPMA_18300 [Tardiphaga alba]|uniref:Uncharacterized protein n=1 Tax=Tardiphaga alba TaxID=340268 RepID=A0ABX8ADV7_9BRAD|nr:hypothetical protein [Tardiphaga alba]QUS40570.1 hypothetical protein RPMA_18300 [Tardiphaga alba]